MDVWSSILVLWRFWGDGSSEAAAAMVRREKYASFGISLSVSASGRRYLPTFMGKEAANRIRAQEAPQGGQHAGHAGCSRCCAAKQPAQPEAVFFEMRLADDIEGLLGA